MITLLTKSTTTTATKSQQLARLRKRADAAWKASKKAGEPLLSNAPHLTRWHKLKRQIDNLEGSFVVYQGRDVDAEAVAYQSGDISTGENTYISGDERLHRTADGTYYLWRKEGRELVHRLSLRAALLWSVTRANIAGPGLRRDVNAIFHTNQKRRAA